MADRFHNMLGIAQRAGAVVSGTLSCIKTLKTNQGELLLLASDAAPEVVKEANYYATRAGVKVLPCSDKVSLGQAIGKSPRAVVLVKDKGLAERLLVLNAER